MTRISCGAHRRNQVRMGFHMHHRDKCTEGSSSPATPSPWLFRALPSARQPGVKGPAFVDPATGAPPRGEGPGPRAGDQGLSASSARGHVNATGSPQPPVLTCGRSRSLAASPAANPNARDQTVPSSFGAESRPELAGGSFWCYFLRLPRTSTFHCRNAHMLNSGVRLCISGNGWATVRMCARRPL